MADSHAMDVRVKYLEQLTKQLGDQVKVMKQLVSTEVADLKTVMQSQLAEVKQIVMHQDRVYQDRIRRLETRVEQLSEFSMQLARTTGSSGHMAHVPLDFGDRGAADGSPVREASPGADDDDDIDDDKHRGVGGVINKYADKISRIYQFYTTSNIQVFHPAMTMEHFTKMLRDCRLCDFDSGTPAELLWMAVMRKLGKNRARRQQSRLKHASTITTGKFTATKSNQHSFAYERLDEIPANHFGEALFYLSIEKLGKHRSDLPPETVFDTFLVTEIFPNVDVRMERHAAALTTDMVGAESIQAYKTPEVKAVMKEYLPRIRESFHECIAYTDYMEAQKPQPYMNLDGFVELVRRHHLFPLITKPDIRQIFLACQSIEAAKNPDAAKRGGGYTSEKALILALYHLADRIYGDRLYADQFPTPEARVRKLLAKMFLLE